MQVTTALHMELYNVDRELMRQELPPELAEEGRGEGLAPEAAGVAAQR
jgi:hypothetical protein